MNSLNLVMRWKFPLLLAILLSFLFLYFFENRAYVELEIQVPQKTWFNIYWEAEGDGYSRWRRARVRVFPEKQEYRFYLTDLRKIHSLRIDPFMYEGDILLKKISISQDGLQPLQFATESDFEQIKPLFHIGSSQWKDDGFHVSSTGNDPQLKLLVNVHEGASMTWTRIVAIFTLVFLFFICTEKFRTEETFIPLLFSVVFVLIIVMAAITVENVHPDEYVHLEAATYYQSNYFPPEVDDPAIRSTYSVYGVSRLNSYEVSYLFNGIVANLLAPHHLPKYLNLRMFNVLLFALLLLYILACPSVRAVAAPLLISPQLWYVFSYCDSDAFALVISFLIACQVVLPGSMLNRYLLQNRVKTNLFVVFLLGCLFALLFLLKKNYFFFILFIGGYVLWNAFFKLLPEQRKSYGKRMIIVVCIGLSLAGLRIGADYAINGMNRNEVLAQIQEDRAGLLYKPSTPLEKKHPLLHQKDRGISLKEMVVATRWFEQSFHSAFGQYGYFSVSAVDSYYNCIRIVGLAFFVFLGGAVVFRGGLSGNLLFMLFISCASGLIAASLYNSWTMDLQPQGRYLFPIIPMLCVVLCHVRQLMKDTVYKVLLISMFTLSLYSFIFVALIRLPKVL